MVAPPCDICHWACVLVTSSLKVLDRLSCSFIHSSISRPHAGCHELRRTKAKQGLCGQGVASLVQKTPGTEPRDRVQWPKLAQRGLNALFMKEKDVLAKLHRS